MATTTKKPAPKRTAKAAPKRAAKRTAKPAARQASKTTAAKTAKDAMRSYVFSGTYKTKDSALKALDAVKALHKDKAIGTYEASAFERTADGKVKMIRTIDPLVSRGAGWGLLTGAVIGVVFPPATLAALAGSAVYGAVGAGIGAVAMEVHKSFGRSTIKQIGDKLEKGSFGVVVVAKATPALTIAKVLPRAVDPTKKEIGDSKAVARQLDATERSLKAKASAPATKAASRTTTRPRAASKPAARATKPKAATKGAAASKTKAASKPASKATAASKPTKTTAVSKPMKTA
ncbi:MAG: DUF1269 domain-containing protein, partial [Coriobacteriales bacterium]|nr:DUF1269 domain-containing protein [Coriobacteriales bacterium]